MPSSSSGSPVFRESSDGKSRRPGRRARRFSRCETSETIKQQPNQGRPDMKNILDILFVLAFASACASTHKNTKPATDGAKQAAPAAAAKTEAPKAAEAAKTEAGAVNCSSGADHRVLKVSAKGTG